MPDDKKDAPLVSDKVFHVSDEVSGDGWTIYTQGGWGLGFVFTHRAFADAACRALNDNAALDALHDS